MDFIIPADILGTDFSLIVREGGIYEKHNPNHKLEKRTINIKARSFWERVKLYGLQPPAFPPKRFTKPYEQLIGRDKKIPWVKCLPRGIYQKALKEYIEKIVTILSTDFEYYDRYFLQTESLFKGLEPACVDIDKFNGFMDSGASLSNRAILKSFTPTEQTNETYFAAPVVYSRSSSKTGRLTVVNGPSILHLRKDFRKILKSRYENGGIFYLDFKSLEPRALLAIRNPEEQLPKDLYEHTLKNLGLQGAVDREHVKTALISIINGAGDKEITRQLNGKIDYPEDFIKAIKEHFGLEELRESLSDGYAEQNGRLIYNHYKRPILCRQTPPYVLLNYFIQSTSVDIAMLGFNAIYEKLVSSNAIDLCKPIFILHDALILDVAPEMFHLLEKIAMVGTKIPKFENTQFWIDIERLDNA